MAREPLTWGPDNPHPLSRTNTELMWEGKYDEYGNRRPIRLPTLPLPLQRIETIDEPWPRSNLATAKEHAQKAKDLANCDGPPDYTYKAAYDEAGALLAELESHREGSGGARSK